MLNLFRKHATSWLIKVALFLIVIVFIFWGGYSYKSQKETQIARVDDHYISVADFNKAYDQMLDLYRRQLGSSFSEDLVKQLNLKRQALDMLINRYLLSKAANQLGLGATSQEVQQKILTIPAFQTDGKFDQKRYVFVLQQNHLTPEMFEQQLEGDLSVQKVEDFIKRRAVVTEEDVQADFHFNYDQIQVSYVAFDPKSFEDQVTVEPKAIEGFYESHKDRYMDPEKRQIETVLFKSDAYLDKVKVTDSDISQYYEDNRATYHQDEEVHARHILFSVKEDAPEAEVAKVRAEAEKVLQEAKSGKDFAALAKEYSQDPGSAKQGGDLGFFTRDRMAPAFSEAAFALKPGEISGLVRTPFGFHIIKVEEVRPEKTATLDEVRDQISKTLKEERARDMAYGKARAFADVAYAQKDIEKAAQEQKLEVAGAGVWLKLGDPLAGLGSTSPQIMSKLFALPDKGTSDVLEIPQGFIVAQVKAVQPAQALPLEQVKDRVEKDYRAEQARIMAQQKAAALLEAARKDKGLDAASKEAKLEVKTTEWFSRREPDKNFKLLGEGLNVLFRLDEKQPFPDAPLEMGNRPIVCQLMGRKSPTELLEKERPAITKRLEQQKQGMVWQSWLEEQRRKAKVETYKEL